MAGLGKKILEKFKPAASGVFSAPGVIKKKALNALSGSLEGTSDADDGEGAAQNAVEAVAKKLGVPEDSVAGNVAKAVGVAAIEGLAPDNLLDVLPIGKIVSKGKRVVSALDDVVRKQKVDKVMDVLRSGRVIDPAKSVKGQSTVKMLNEKPMSAAEQLRTQGVPEVQVKPGQVFGEGNKGKRLSPEEFEKLQAALKKRKGE